MIRSYTAAAERKWLTLPLRGEDLQLEPRNMSTASTVDVEAQGGDSHPHGEESEAGTRRHGCKPSARMIADSILGLSDGLTVPFALTAGLSSFGETHVVIFGGLAELFAGAISMGVGAFVASKSEAYVFRCRCLLSYEDHQLTPSCRASYAAKVAEARKLITSSPGQASSLVTAVFQKYGLPVETIVSISNHLHESPEQLLDFLMRFHYQEAEPDSSRPYVSAGIIATSYLIGGFLPLVPYLCVKHNEVLKGLWWSIGVMAIALFIFGWGKIAIVHGWKGRKNVMLCVKSAVEMVGVGTVAAGTAVGLVRAMNHG
ncbi:MAG: hypothetical protein FRX48_05320 [Lasallia pustulata]|uniref:Vacuolar iron transporter Ccc1 n=1 Tax=Lasallia pustulata TaxID=136370 RepID=A0A5M8PNB4_9LECA|nr:MAG: hypothetical protein FRX48_05320 [Lasallia pustulata]